jgi:MOSC domain-containing protein YiiM
MDAPRVIGLFTAATAGEPMHSHESVEVARGLGISGDRYATRRGHWSDPKWRDQQLTLVGIELIEELGLAPDALRRNIVTRGIDLNDLVGLEFGIGDAVMRAQRICAPCGYIGRLNGRPGLFAELDGRGGIRVSVVGGGTIRVGDKIQVVELDDPIAEDSGPPGRITDAHCSGGPQRMVALRQYPMSARLTPTSNLQPGADPISAHSRNEKEKDPDVVAGRS